MKKISSSLNFDRRSNQNTTQTTASSHPTMELAPPLGERTRVRDRKAFSLVVMQTKEAFDAQR
jgi:hypothetical protein